MIATRCPINCLLSTLGISIFLFLTVSTKVFAGNVPENLCSSKPIEQWVTKVLAEEKGYKEPHIVYSISRKEIGETVVLAPDPKMVTKQHETKPFRPSEPSLIFMASPETNGVHVRIGVHSCYSWVWLYYPSENSSTGLLSYGMGREYLVTYRVGRSSGELHIAMKDMTSCTISLCSDTLFAGFPPAQEDLADMVKAAKAGRRSINLKAGTIETRKTFKTVNAYYGRVEWKGGIATELFYGIPAL